MKKRIFSLLLTLSLCLGLAACGEKQAQQSPSQPEDTPSGSESVKPALSGKVTVYMPSPAELADELAAAFTEKSGSCKDFLAGLVTGMSDGEAILQNWADNGLTVPGTNKAALEAVTTGEKGILIAGVDYNAYSSMAKGEPLNIYYPASGTVVNPRPAMIPKTAPNMDNAKAFIDFLFSDEAQQLVADAYLLPGRSDVQ